MSNRGVGLARFRTARAAELWPQVRAALVRLVEEHGAPNRFFFTEISTAANVAPRDLGVVFSLSPDARAWLQEHGARIESVSSRRVLVFGGEPSAAPTEGRGAAPSSDVGGSARAGAESATPATAAAPAAEPDDSAPAWLPSLL